MIARWAKAVSFGNTAVPTVYLHEVAVVFDFQALLEIALTRTHVFKKADVAQGDGAVRVLEVEMMDGSGGWPVGPAATSEAGLHRP